MKEYRVSEYLVAKAGKETIQQKRAVVIENKKKTTHLGFHGRAPQLQTHDQRQCKADGTSQAAVWSVTLQNDRKLRFVNALRRNTKWRHIVLRFVQNVPVCQHNRVFPRHAVP
jgi:hypothetical protein